VIDEHPTPSLVRAPGLVPGLAPRVHLLGAGGAGVSGLGLLLAERGHVLSGHDSAGGPFVTPLEAAGIPIAVGASADCALPADAEVVVRSAAVPADDPQVLLAEERGLPVLRYKQALGLLTSHETAAIGVAGTHGKTSTTWLLYEALRGIDRACPDLPTSGVLGGGLHRGLGRNAVLAGAGGLMAVEACEYDRTFLELQPMGGIVTNLEEDHLDYYGSLEALHAAFARFAARIHPTGLLVLSAEAPAFLEEAARCEVWRLGREFELELHGEDQGHFHIAVRGPGWATPVVRLQVPGRFNADNAAAAVAMAVGLRARGQSSARCSELAREAALGVARFEGAGRRFERWGTPGGLPVVHDYAHHPTEVRVTLEAARRVFPGAPIHVLFQPHQASRTARFLPEFIESLRGADRVVVADVYGARRHIDRVTAGASDIVLGLRRAGVDAAEGGDLAHATAEFCAGLEASEPRPAALVLGAGDIDSIRPSLLARLDA
jgi:UDP-N-acetylmuramate--alanine ligase